MPEFNNESSPEILILGIGNVLMGDEGVGVHVIRHLENMPLPEGVACLDGGTGSFLLLEPMQRAKKVILIDATIDGAPAGTVRRLTPRFSKDYPRTLTAHDIGLKDLLDAFYLLGHAPEVILFAVSIAALQEVGTELSPELAAVVPEVARRVVEEVKNKDTEGLGSGHIDDFSQKGWYYARCTLASIILIGSAIWFYQTLDFEPLIGVFGGFAGLIVFYKNHHKWLDITVSAIMVVMALIGCYFILTKRPTELVPPTPEYSRKELLRTLADGLTVIKSPENPSEDKVHSMLERLHKVVGTEYGSRVEALIQTARDELIKDVRQRKQQNLVQWELLRNARKSVSMVLIALQVDRDEVGELGGNSATEFGEIIAHASQEKVVQLFPKPRGTAIDKSLCVFFQLAITAHAFSRGNGNRTPDLLSLELALLNLNKNELHEAAITSREALLKCSKAVIDGNTSSFEEALKSSIQSLKELDHELQIDTKISSISDEYGLSMEAVQARRFLASR